MSAKKVNNEDDRCFAEMLQEHLSPLSFSVYVILTGCSPEIGLRCVIVLQ